MDHFTYTSVPSASTFQKDSSVALAIRRQDRILSHMDWLLTEYEKATTPSKHVILTDLFLTTNFWIKSWHEKRPSIEMQKERYPAVLALFEAAVTELACVMWCPKGQVAAGIEEIFGRDITDDGIRTDSANDTLFFGEIERKAYRLQFKYGQIYHSQLNSVKRTLGMALLNSNDYFTGVTRFGAAVGIGWAPFVMTRERDFYMTAHSQNIYHSSYTGGTVAAAGTMFVEAGVLLGVRPDSGHYRPTEVNTLGALQALQMFGVPLHNVWVLDHLSKVMALAPDFMKTGMSWEKFEEAHVNVRNDRAGRANAASNKATPAASASDYDARTVSSPPLVPGTDHYLQPPARQPVSGTGHYLQPLTGQRLAGTGHYLQPRTRQPVPGTSNYLQPPSRLLAGF
jgi:hypothetical protein